MPDPNRADLRFVGGGMVPKGLRVPLLQLGGSPGCRDPIGIFSADWNNLLPGFLVQAWDLDEQESPTCAPTVPKRAAGAILIHQVFPLPTET